MSEAKRTEQDEASGEAGMDPTRGVTPLFMDLERLRLDQAKTMERIAAHFPDGSPESCELLLEAAGMILGRSVC